MLWQRSVDSNEPYVRCGTVSGCGTPQTLQQGDRANPTDGNAQRPGYRICFRFLRRFKLASESCCCFRVTSGFRRDARHASSFDWKSDSQTAWNQKRTGSAFKPRNPKLFLHASGPGSSSSCGRRRNKASNATCPSMRAKGAPKQKCAAHPKAR
jgi:hypothetical protein